MDKLAKHIDLAHRDVKEVHTSAGKITSRFLKIEKVELEDGEQVSAGLLTDSED
jgi:DNA recombination protein RmuC